MTRTLKLATAAVFAAAILELLSPFLSRFSSEAISLAAFGILGVIAGVLLMRGLRWVAWLTFFGTLIGSIIALSGAMSFSSVPTWLYALISIADLIAAIMLFFHLWQPKAVNA